MRYWSRLAVVTIRLLAAKSSAFKLFPEGARAMMFSASSRLNRNRPKVDSPAALSRSSTMEPLFELRLVGSELEAVAARLNSTRGSSLLNTGSAMTAMDLVGALRLAGSFRNAASTEADG